jgi:hypothetical protein
MKRKRNALRDDEFMAEIYRRAGALTRQRKRRKTFALAFGCCIGVFCLSAVIFHMIGKPPANGNSIPQMSAAVFVENSSVGGYLLTGVLSFSSGVLATMFSIRQKRKNKEGSQDEGE